MTDDAIRARSLGLLPCTRRFSRATVGRRRIGVCQLGIAPALGSAASATLASDMSFLLPLILPLVATVGPLAPPRAAGPDAALQAQVELRSGRTLEGPLVAAGDGRITIQVGDEQQTAALDDVLLFSLSAAPADIAGPPAPPPAVPPDLVFLAGDGGDRLVGHLQGGDEFGVRIEVDGAGPFPIAFDDIERLLPRADRPVDRLAALEGAGADDRIWRRKPDGSLDHVAGVVEGLEGDTLAFSGAMGPLHFDLSEVLAVVLAGHRAPPQTLPGRPVVVRLRGGSRLSAGLLELDTQRVVLATRFAERLELPLSSLASLVARGPGVVLLAELTPVAVEQWPSVGQPADFLFPWHADLSVTGRLLSVGGIPRATGLGVHANTRLVFALPEHSQRLRVTGGLVDEVSELAAAGSVRFQIQVDDRVATRSEVVREGQEPAVLRVDDLRGARRLELLVDDGGDDDAGDRAAWVDGVILLDA